MATIRHVQIGSGADEVRSKHVNYVPPSNYMGGSDKKVKSI